MLPSFELVEPRSLTEALDALKAGGQPFAGGTNLIPDLRSGKGPAGPFVSLASLEGLRGITLDGDVVIMGACTTMSDILNTTDMRRWAPGLVAQAEVFAGHMVRNAATVGGNICYGSPSADVVPPLLALDADVVMAGPGGEHTMALERFLLDYKKTALKPGELVTAVRWQVPPENETHLFYKLGRRKGDAITVTGVAVALAAEQGRCIRARIALGSVAPTVFRAREAERFLEGQVVMPSLIDVAGRQAAAMCKADQRSARQRRLSPPYRLRLDPTPADPGLGTRRRTCCREAAMTDTRTITLTVNGRVHEVAVPAHRTLLELLRELGHVDVKCGCEKGDCGACAVLLDGVAVDSCLTLGRLADDCAITTVAGLGSSDNPHPLQTAFIEHGAVQCGYCIPGMIVARPGADRRTSRP